MRPTIERIFVCPDIDCQASAMEIYEIMDNTPAVLETEVSLADKTVRVVMADIDGETSVRYHLAHAGFPPED